MGWWRWYRRGPLKRDIILTILYIGIPALLLYLLSTKPIIFEWIGTISISLLTNVVLPSFGFAIQVIIAFTVVMYLHFLIRSGINEANQIHWRMVPDSTPLIYGQYALRAIIWISLVDVLQQIYSSYRTVNMYFSGYWTVSKWEILQSLFIFSPLLLLENIVWNYFIVVLTIPYVMRRHNQLQSLLAGMFCIILTRYLIDLFFTPPYYIIGSINFENFQSLSQSIRNICYKAVELSLIFWARWIARQTAGRFWEWPEMEGSVWSPRFFAEVTGLDRAVRAIGRAIKRARKF